jgi:hypothetical protein
MPACNTRREPILTGNGTALVPLTKGQFATIDAQDSELVGRYQWHAQRTRTGYVAAHGEYVGRKRVRVLYMHQLLAASPDLPCVDHRDHNQLNNRRSNLRPCTYSQNAFNRKKYRVKCTSQYKGVMLYKGQWRAQIYVDKKVKPLGVFETETDAAMAYDRAASRFYGEFANTNFRRTA